MKDFIKKNFCIKIILGAWLTLSFAMLVRDNAIAAELTPYFWNWGGGAASSLMDAKQQMGLQSATIAFVTSGGDCTDDRSTLAMSADIEEFIASGGKVIISFGGAAGTYIETACTDEDQLFSLIDNIIQRLGTQRLDFDVEGSQLSDASATGRRTRVLARLQSKYPNLYVSFTLPVGPGGLPSAAVNLLKSTAAGGVHIGVINIMTMNYGSGTTNLGDVAIQSAEATVLQLISIYPSMTSAQRYAMMGITPMIGVNDDGTVFTVSDAEKIANHVNQKRIGRLSYWALQRDQKGTDIASSSGTQQSKFAYYLAFMQACQGGIGGLARELPCRTNK
jgi:hypothetical protein